MHGFPNFFILHGPNTITEHSSVILASEMMVKYALHFVPRILNCEINTCERKTGAELKYTAEIQDRLRRNV